MNGDPGFLDDTVLAHAAASSTTPLEAAVVLESAGVDDRVVCERFGGTDVFDLAERALADPHRGVSEPLAPPPPLVWSLPGDRRWTHARGVVYAVPAVVALSLLPTGDPAAAGLLLGGLLLAWAASYGVTSVAWSHLGNLDLPGARWFLRRALLAGGLLALLASTVAVFAVLLLTSTTSVDLITVLMLAGQATYLLAAAALLMCGREAWLLAALAPAMVGALLGLALTQPGPVGALGAPIAVPGRDLLWPAASVVLAVALALVATRRGRRPRAGLVRSAWSRAGTQVGHGLFVAVLVLFPALDQLVHPGFDPLPQSVTLVALPLVLCMGIAESLAHRFRWTAAGLLGSTGSTAWFARAARRAALRAHLVFAGVLAGATVLLGVVVVMVAGDPDGRVVLLGVDYLVLGVALFATTVLTVLGRDDRVLAVLAAGVTALSAFLARAEPLTSSSSTAIVWHLGTNTLLLGVLGVLVARAAGVPVRHR